MFRSRTSSQKPDEELYAAFKQNFPGVGPGPVSAGPGPAQRSSSLSEALTDANLPNRYAPSTGASSPSFSVSPKRLFTASAPLPCNMLSSPEFHAKDDGDGGRGDDDGDEDVALTSDDLSRYLAHLEDGKDHEATPKAFHDHWRFTPSSLMDPNSFAFSTFASQPPGYYTPTPGGVNTLYHNQAGDLHTPGMGMSIGTPLSLPQSANALSVGSVDVALQHYQPHLLQSQQFENVANYAPQQIFAPSSFLQHKDSGFEAMSQSPRPSRHQSPSKLDSAMLPSSANMSTFPKLDVGGAVPSGSNGDNFRYHATLNAPTAMIKHSDEIPISYLNKGQAYSLSIVDTFPPVVPSAAPARYRTFVRVSFEDEEQRSKPEACWQLWKEGRGTTEAHQREGKLLAVEFVDTNQGGDGESRKPQIELASNSFDGFCVTWGPNPVNGRPECSISVRFNFLSTDFSHSKGVKGIPVRLCAKTEKIVPEYSGEPLANQPEVCYAKVKLFRDHGAERKLSNDVAHVKKSIEKLKQQISQAESGMPTFGKRKRSGSVAKASGNKGPGKIVKHKRTWSMASDGEEAPTQSTPEEDLVMKLNTMQDMFSSTRSVSVLYLPGDREDDPDLFPVHLFGEQQDPNSLTRHDTWDSKPSAASTTPTSNAVSPTSTANGVVTPRLAQANLQPPGPVSDGPVKRGSVDAPLLSGSSTSPSPTQPASLLKAGSSGRAINVLGVHTHYQAPAERPIKPVACFYVRQKDSRDSYYRAVYLMQRTVKDLVNVISQKFHVDPTCVMRVTHLNQKGLHIIVDEDVVRELPEEQDMIVEFSKQTHEKPVKSEICESTTTDMMVDGDFAVIDDVYKDSFEMWLDY